MVHEEHARTTMDAKASKSDDGVSSLPEDIVFEVLSRLPTKPLCRFRCVCKRWHTLISDPAFIAAQRPSAAADPHLVGVFLGARNLSEVRVMDMDGKVVSAFKITRNTVPLPPQQPSRPDLICADDRTGSRQHRDIIIDPAAGKAFAAFGTIDLGPSTMLYSTIFGRATPSGVFKVLRLHEPSLEDDSDSDGDSDVHQIWEVATILDARGGISIAAEALSWRRKSAPPFFVTWWSYDQKPIVINGVVYFTHEVETVDEYGDPTMSFDCIVAFDLESEEWKIEAISGPALGHQPKEDTRSIITLAELKGTLGLVHDVHVNQNQYLYTSIWLLIDPDKSVWVKEYTEIPMPMNQAGPTKPLGALVDGKILLLSSLWENEATRQKGIRFSRPRDLILFYDPSTKKFTDFMEMGKGFTYTLVFYAGSLLS